MSTIAASTLSPTAPTTPTSPIAPVIDPPPSVTALEPGTIVQGTVTGRDNQGLLLVKTDAGNIVIQTPQLLQPGAKLQLEIQVQGSQLQVVILSADRPPAADATGAAQLLAQSPALAADTTAVTTRGLGANLVQVLADKGLPPGLSTSLGAAVATALLAADAAAPPPVALLAGTVATALLVQPGEALAAATPQGLSNAYGPAQLAAQAGAQAAAALAGAVQPQTPEAVVAALAPLALGPEVPAQVTQAQAAQAPVTQAPAAQALTAQNPATQATAAGAPTAQTPIALPPATPVQAAQVQAAQTQAIQAQASQARVQVTPAAVLLAAQSAATPPAGLPAAAPGAGAPTGLAAAALQTGVPNLPGAAAAATVASQTTQGVQAVVAPLANQPAGNRPAAIPLVANPPEANQTAAGQTAVSQARTGQAGTGQAGAGQTTANQPAAGGQAQPALPASGAFTVRVLAVTSPTAGGTPGVPQSVVVPTGNAPVLTGTVLFSTPQNQPVVQTGAGVITLNVRAELPVGSTVTLEVLGEAPPAPAPTTAAGAPAPLVSLSRQWPTLDETIQALRQIDPQLAQTVVRTILPPPGPHLTSGMLFFMAALKSGDVRAWIGEPAVRALEGAGKGRLLGKLSDEFKELGRGRDVSEGEWRGFFLPVNDGQQIQQVRLFVHKHGAGKDADGEAEGTRFMLDVEMSRLGPVQIDGLVRSKRLDLVVRTRQALPEEMRRDINALFVTAGETTGFTGGLTFQAGPKMPPPPLEQVVGHRPDVVV
jgi:hypothetical protein